MGADLLIASLVVERDRSLDFEAGRAAIDRLTPEDIFEPALYFDEDPQTGAGLGAIRERLRRWLHLDLFACQTFVQRIGEHGRNADLHPVRFDRPKRRHRRFDKLTAPRHRVGGQPPPAALISSSGALRR